MSRISKITIVGALLLLVSVGACSVADEDGYLAPPDDGTFDAELVRQRAHAALATSTYQSVTQDRACRDTCGLYERGFARARYLKLASPAQCTNEFELGLGSQTEYQEGCRAYALKVISLVDELKLQHRERSGS